MIMETSFEYFKGLGCKEVPFDKLPKGYAWITGCGGNDGWYYNFFMDTKLMNSKSEFTDEDNKKVLMCKIERL